MPAPTAPQTPPPEPDPDIDGLFEGDLSAGPSARAATPTPPGAPMDFDLAGLSLDLDATAGAQASSAAPKAPATGEADPLVTKLSLAEEFRTIGDIDFARSLLEEVRDQAQGELRERAERLLAELE
jgi:pilus assembly protein FimV